MRSRLLVKASSAAALSLFALTAWAVHTGVQVSGVNPGDIASGTISFGNQPAQPLVSRNDCENQEANDESCDRAFLWFAASDAAPAIGTTVKVTLTDRNGNTTTGTGTVTDNGIRVSVPDFTKPGAPKTASSGVPGFRVNVGYDEHTLPAGNGGLGIRFTPGSPGSEQFILLSPRRFEGDATQVAVSTPFGWDVMDRKTYLGLLAYYGAWDVDEAALFPTGAEGRGWAHQVENSPSGSTGIAFSGATTELNLTADHNIEKWGFGIGGMGVPSAENGLSFGAMVEYSETTQDIVNGVSSPQFTGPNFVGAAMTQEVRDRNLMLPLIIRKTWNDGQTVSPFVQAQVAPGYHDSDLSGTYVSTCNLCGPSDAVVTQTIDDSDSGFTWEAGAGLGIDFRVGRNFVIGLFANYGYSDRVSFADNRESPLDDPPHLGDDNADFWAAGVNFGMEFRY